MSKPTIEHEYHPKKDRFEITLRHFDLKKKRLRHEVIDALTVTLKSAHHKKGRHVKDPIPKNRLEEVGD